MFDTKNLQNPNPPGMARNGLSGIDFNPVDITASLRPSSSARVYLVRTDQQMDAVVSIRRKAYLRTPSQSDLVKFREADDSDRTAIVLLAEDCRTGEPVGTMRINCGSDYLKSQFPELDLSTVLWSPRVCFVSRYAVVSSIEKSRTLLRGLLIKACYQVCAAMQSPQVVIVAPARRARMFRQLGFQRIFPIGMAAKLDAYGDELIVPLIAETFSYERTLRRLRSPLHPFIFQTFHPEIEVFQSISSVPSRGASEKLSNVQNARNNSKDAARI